MCFKIETNDNNLSLYWKDQCKKLKLHIKLNASRGVYVIKGLSFEITIKGELKVMSLEATLS